MELPIKIKRRKSLSQLTIDPTNQNKAVAPEEVGKVHPALIKREERLAKIQAIREEIRKANQAEVEATREKLKNEINSK